MEKIKRTKRREVFNTLYSRHAYSGTLPAAQLLPKKSLEWIYKYQGWFDKEHWDYIGKEHALALDLEQVDDRKRKEVFYAVYSPFGRTPAAAELLPKKPLEWIYKYADFFFSDHWQYIGEAHILNFDILQIPVHKRKEICGLLFSPFGRDPDAKKYLPRMSPKQKEDLRPYLFSDALHYL